MISSASRLGEASLELAKQTRLAFGLIFLAQPFKHALEQRHGPAMLEQLVRGALVHGFNLVARFRRAAFERNQTLTATPFLRLQAVPFVGEEMVQAREQE